MPRLKLASLFEPTAGGFYVRATAGCDYTLEVNGSDEVTGDPTAC